jgi:hypothetical protein
MKTTRLRPFIPPDQFHNLRYKVLPIQSDIASMEIK